MLLPWRRLEEVKRSHYRILGLVGQGQFGQVFCAVHRQTGQLVALKHLDHRRFSTHRFLRELRFLLSLQHPNIVTCQALEHTPTGRCLVMDYCEGGTLRSLMREDYRLSLPHSIKLVVDVLAGLEHAHSRQIIHCDIKPENILLHVQATGWTARISDFGIARLCQEDVACELGNTGSPAYMAPERFYGQSFPASDLYSVGILLFELLAGYRPFSGTPAELMSAHLNLPLKIPDSISAPWQPLLIQALQKLPARRFRSAREMRSLVQEIAAAEGIEAQFLAPTSPIPTSAASAALPPFLPLETPPRGLFRWQHQEPLLAPLRHIAVAAAQTTAMPQVYAATAQQVGWQDSVTLPYRQTSATRSLHYLAPLPLPIEALWLRPQGCFITTRRAVYRLPPTAFLTAPAALDQHRPLWEFPEDCLSAIEVRGHWLATLTLTHQLPRTQLAFWPLPGGAARGLVAHPVPLSLPAPLAPDSRLLALDGGHVALMMPLPEPAEPTESQQAGTYLQIVTRRGTQVGSLVLPLRLGYSVLTATAYQLLAVDADHPQSLLLIDLKPYRVTRLWVGMAPHLLAASDWGYIVASAQGQISVLDQSGRLVGEISAPEAITALAVRPPRDLLVATWSAGQGSLYQLDLSQVGIDLVF